MDGSDPGDIAVAMVIFWPIVALILGLSCVLFYVLSYLLSYLLPIIFNYWAVIAVILKVILIVFFCWLFGMTLYGIKNGEGIGATILLALLLCNALVWGYPVWKGKLFSTSSDKNITTTRSQADNSASPKAQLAAEKSAREQSEVAKAEEERKRKEAEQVLKKEQTSIARQSTARKYKVGDKITFGSYPFYADGLEKAIDWIILDIDKKGNALVISDYALDNVKYNEYVTITWEDSSIRKWLNNDFLNKAFSPEQRSNIISSRIANKYNAKYITRGGNPTTDKLFLLSIEEAEKYFKDDESRIAYPTPYAKSRKSVNGKLSVSDKYFNADRGGSCWWWLRSPGDDRTSAAGVHYDGNVSSDGLNVTKVNGAVRVAFKINLNNIYNETDKASVVEQTSNKQQTESAENDHRRKAEEAKKKKEERKARKLVAQQAEAAKAAARQYKVGDKIYNVGNIITFGSYPFYADGSKKAIDWKILDIDENGDALVISDYALDNVKYNKRKRDITWEESSIRKWLNGTFIDKAFTAEQRSKIILSKIENDDNAEYGTKGGNNTYDKLFLLSIDEAEKYFKNDEARRAYPTPYAKSKKSVNGNLYEPSGGSCWWWLRSPGDSQNHAATVYSDGCVFSYGGSRVNYYGNAVRMAFKINLNNL